MPTTRGQQRAAAPTAEQLKAALVDKDYITAATLVTLETLTPENRAMIEKIKTSPYVDNPQSRLKDQMKAVTEGRSLAAEAAQKISDRMYVNRGFGTGGRKTRKSKKSKKSRTSRKTRSRRV